MELVCAVSDDADDACRRTADVRSVGYSELFVLSREDVLAAFKDHPEAEVKLMVTQWNTVPCL